MHTYFPGQLLSLLALSLCLLASCDQKKTETTKVTILESGAGSEEARLKEVKRIDSLETLIRQEVKQQRDPDISLAMYAIQAYQYFAADFPKDSLSPNYLFKAGQLYEGVLQEPKKAIANYEKVYTNYPEFDKRGMTLFITGNLYHELQDTAKAIQAFQTFQKDYPKHEFADDAAGMIQYIRMKDAERSQTFGGKPKTNKGV